MVQKATPDELSIQMQFVNAWIACDNPELDSVNPHFKNKYASLKATLKVIREACREQGIAYVQHLARNDDGTCELRSAIVSAFGEQIPLSTFPVEAPPNPQSFGSNLTYAKRQQAQADWGITGEVDDDGNAGAEYAQNRQSKPNRAAAPKRAQSPRQGAPEAPRREAFARIAKLKMQAMENGVREEGINSWFNAKYGDTPINKLSDQQVSEVIQYLEAIVRDSADMHLVEGQQ